MERTKKVEKDPQIIRWKKVGGGSLRLFGKIIKPNQEFLAREIDIPKNFRDVIVPLEPIPVKDAVEPVKLTYTKKSYTAPDPEDSEKEITLYDILDSTGKKVNEKGLTKEVADQFIADLRKQ